MDYGEFDRYWNDIPTEREKAITYSELMTLWNSTERKVRKVLSELSRYDNGDDFVIIRSGSNHGFYKTDNPETLKAYRSECLNKGKSLFAPVKKINRILRTDAGQYTLTNNLRVMRELRGMKQSEVCRAMKAYDKQFDKSLLSKMENGVCLPTPAQLTRLSEIYNCTARDLVTSDLYQ